MIIIRKATLNDYEALLNLQVAFVKEMQKFDSLLNPVKFKERFGKDLKKILRERKSVILLAESEGDIIGFAHAFVYKIYSYDKKYLYLEAIYVRPAYRSQSMGKKLFEELNKIGKKRGLAKIRLESHSNNTKVIQLWKQLGFAEVCKTFERSL